MTLVYVFSGGHWASRSNDKFTTGLYVWRIGPTNCTQVMLKCVLHKIVKTVYTSMTASTLFCVLVFSFWRLCPWIESEICPWTVTNTANHTNTVKFPKSKNAWATVVATISSDFIWGLPFPRSNFSFNYWIPKTALYNDNFHVHCLVTGPIYNISKEKHPDTAGVIELHPQAGWSLLTPNQQSFHQN